MTTFEMILGCLARIVLPCLAVGLIAAIVAERVTRA
jgi:hypothetical protein